MAVILVKDFEEFSVDRKELNERLKEIGFPRLRGWKASRCVLYAMRDIDKLRSSRGQIVAKKAYEDKFGNEVYTIGTINGSYLPVLKVAVKGERVEEKWLTDENVKDEIGRKWKRKFGYYKGTVSSREISEYIAIKVVPKFKGFPIAKNTYIAKEDEALQKFAEVVNSYAPSIFLLEFKKSQRNTIVQKLKERVEAMIRREDTVSLRKVGELLSALEFLQSEGFDFSEEIGALLTLKEERKRKK